MVICLAGCKGKHDAKYIQKQMIGNWFVTYPEEKLEGYDQEQKYAEIQDSLINDRGIKMISFFDDGRFILWDSTMLEGKWGLMEDSFIVINCPGKGFLNFQGVYNEIGKNEVVLAESVLAGFTFIRVGWHCIRINKGEEATLFDRDHNNWRIKPEKPESEPAMKKRLSEMLAYYSLYFKLISDHASYFIPSRVMLPLKFYQHAIGMRDFDEQHRFVSLFYSIEDARKAYSLLKEAVNDADYDIPESDDKSYTTEYYHMLKHLAEEIMK